MKRALLLALIALSFIFAAALASTAVADEGGEDDPAAECKRTCQVHLESCEVSCPPESDACYQGCFDIYVDCLDACEA